MADDLDENYELEEKYRPHLANDVSDEETEISSVPSDNKSKKRKFEDLVSNGNKANKLIKSSSDDSEKKKKKKKNITEILKLKKDEFTQPAYATNEFKKFFFKFMNEKLSSVEKNAINFNQVGVFAFRFCNDNFCFYSVEVLDKFSRRGS